MSGRRWCVVAPATEALEVPHGVLVRVMGPDYMALSFVPGLHLEDRGVYHEMVEPARRDMERTPLSPDQIRARITEQRAAGDRAERTNNGGGAS